MKRKKIVAATKERSVSWLVILFLGLSLLFSKVGGVVVASHQDHRSSAIDNHHQPTCIDDGRFFRNPRTPAHAAWSLAECAKYYLCLDDEVFEFRCSEGLLFDVSRQICDFKANVDNCDVTLEERPPKPLLKAGNCPEGRLACGDGNCLFSHYFCDGSPDCVDGSDEAWCDGQEDPHAAQPCDPVKCQLPDCWCSRDGTEVPGNLTVSAIPQIITLTFDDAVNPENFDLFTKIFTEDRKNPNGCPISATFFVSHQYTNYRDVQHLWNMGHEIAVHSITHRGPEDWWSQNATIEDWFDEMVGQANIINRFAGVRMEDIRGLRVPFFQLGWNRQFLMMSEFGFTYDSSIIGPLTKPPVWPFTLDYQMPFECSSEGQSCPTRAYPGIWQIPVSPIIVKDQGCHFFDSCNRNLSTDDVYSTLLANFNAHYLTNRAPLGLHLQSSWLQNPNNFNGLLKFIDEVLQGPDAYFVNNQHLIEWMRHPTPFKTIRKFRPWQCYQKKFDTQEIACHLPNSCKLLSRVLKAYRYLHTCFECPQYYPWLRNEFGQE